jgi:cell shape-determining protein MreD
MHGARSSMVIVLVAFAMLLTQSSFSRVLAPYPLSPYLGLPLVFALGTTPGVRILRGAATAFAIGYLYDHFTANPLGFHTFVFVIGFALTVFLGGLLEIIRGFTPGGMFWNGVTLTIALFASAFATALVAPVLFAMVRWIDPASARAST